jgi:hypothetical protein
MHDGGGYPSKTVATLPTIIASSEQRGFQESHGNNMTKCLDLLIAHMCVLFPD